MSIEDPPPPQRVPDWPTHVTDDSMITSASYPRSINRPSVLDITGSGTRPAPPTSGFATAALVTGLATLITLGFTGVLAIIFGHLAISETRTGRRSGHGMALTGLVFGYLALAFWVGFLAVLFATAVSAALS